MSKSAEKHTRIVEGYEIFETIHQGPFSCSHKALELSSNRIVLLKQVPSQKRQRFLNERATLFQLNHSFIVKLLNSFESNGEGYLVLEFLEGKTLREVFPQLRYEDSLTIGQTVLDALAHAHERGVSHRDLTPSNIIVTTNKDGRWVGKLIDFGISIAGDTVRDTQEDIFVGSPPYSAPERFFSDLNASSEKFLFQSDLYSMGVILYKCWTSKHPFHTEALANPSYTYHVISELWSHKANIHQFDGWNAAMKQLAELPEQAQKLACRLLHPDPLQRAQTVQEAMFLLNECIKERIAFQYQHSRLPTGLVVLESWDNATLEYQLSLPALVESDIQPTLEEKPESIEQAVMQSRERPKQGEPCTVETLYPALETEPEQVAVPCSVFPETEDDEQTVEAEMPHHIETALLYSPKDSSLSSTGVPLFEEDMSSLNGLTYASSTAESSENLQHIEESEMEWAYSPFSRLWIRFREFRQTLSPNCHQARTLVKLGWVALFFGCIGALSYQYVQSRPQSTNSKTSYSPQGGAADSVFQKLSPPSLLKTQTHAYKYLTPETEAQVTQCVELSKQLGLGRPRLAGDQRSPLFDTDRPKLHLFNHLDSSYKKALKTNVLTFVKYYKKAQATYRCKRKSYILQNNRFQRCKEGERIQTAMLLRIFENPALYRRLLPIERCLFNRLLVRAYLWFPDLNQVERVMDRSIPATKGDFDDELRELKQRHQELCFQTPKPVSGTLKIHLYSTLLQKRVHRSLFEKTAWPVSAKKGRLFCARVLSNLPGFPASQKIRYTGKVFVSVTTSQGKRITIPLSAVDFKLKSQTQKKKVIKISSKDFALFEGKLEQAIVGLEQSHSQCKPGYLWVHIRTTKTVDSSHTYPICLMNEPVSEKLSIVKADVYCRQRGATLTTRDFLASASSQKLVSISPQGEWITNVDTIEQKELQGRAYMTPPWRKNKSSKLTFSFKHVYHKNQAYVWAKYSYNKETRNRKNKPSKVFPVFRCFYRPNEQQN